MNPDDSPDGSSCCRGHWQTAPAPRSGHRGDGRSRSRPVGRLVGQGGRSTRRRYSASICPARALGLGVAAQRLAPFPEPVGQPAGGYAVTASEGGHGPAFAVQVEGLIHEAVGHLLARHGKSRRSWIGVGGGGLASGWRRSVTERLGSWGGLREAAAPVGAGTYGEGHVLSGESLRDGPDADGVHSKVLAADDACCAGELPTGQGRQPPRDAACPGGFDLQHGDDRRGAGSTGVEVDPHSARGGPRLPPLNHGQRRR